MDTIVYGNGEPGFNDIFFAGRKLTDIEDTTASWVYFQHLYRSTFSSHNKRHACLIFGYWCFQNLREHPKDILPYLAGKVYVLLYQLKIRKNNLNKYWVLK